MSPEATKGIMPIVIVPGVITDAVMLRCDARKSAGDGGHFKYPHTERRERGRTDMGDQIF
jgi:hypothetical protein